MNAIDRGARPSSRVPGIKRSDRSALVAFLERARARDRASGEAARRQHPWRSVFYAMPLVNEEGE